ncbi:MAG: NAD-dependent epimerase/dehydratase family protein [Bacteroidota bacterium]
MVLVTGGTGLLGAHLLLALCKQDKPVRALFRSERTLEAVKTHFTRDSAKGLTYFESIDWVKGDIIDLQSLKVAFADITEVYHAAAMVSFDPKEDQQLFDINIGGTSNVVNLCIALKIQKLCFVSSIAALGSGTKQKMINEEEEWLPGKHTGYAISKHYAEMEVWRASQEGVDVVIVNPGIILAAGFWKSSSGLLFRHAHKGSQYYLPNGNGFVGVNDVVSAMVQLMESPIVNERYILVNENWTYRTFSELMAKALQKTPPKKELKPWMLSILWRADWIRQNFLGKRRRLSRALARNLTMHTLYDNRKVKEDLGFEFEDLKGQIAAQCAIYLEEQVRASL